MKRIVWPAVAFITLIAVLAFVARHFDTTISIAAASSVTLLLAPYWAFGFGFDEWLKKKLRNGAARVLAPLSLICSSRCQPQSFDGTCFWE